MDVITSQLIVICLATVSTIILLAQLGSCQRYLVDVGPSNIQRFEGERNVYIPCPFPGSSNPIWKINGIEYEAFNLPTNMLPVSYGLLITSVEPEMDGKSFQCILLSGQQKTLSSTIGILTVEKLPKAYDTGILEAATIVETTPSSIYLDHQQMIFEDVFKTFAWRMDKAPVNSTYTLKSRNCSGHTFKIWNDMHEQSLRVISPDLIHNNISLLFLNLTASSAQSNISLPTTFTARQQDITEDVPTSYNGTCVSFTSRSPVIILPRKGKGKDCFCPVLSYPDSPSYNVSKCSCINDTEFVNTVLIHQSSFANGLGYKMCFSNLTQKMNNTIVHICESYRSCINNFGTAMTTPHRIYTYSMKLLIDLPSELYLSVNGTTGDVYFSVITMGGIYVDHYQISIQDITGLVFVYRKVEGDKNSTSFGNMFQINKCSPYNVTVKAYNSLDNSLSHSITVPTDTEGDRCDCIKDYVAVGLSLDDDDSQNYGIIINCSQQHYEERITVNVTVQHHKYGAIVNTTTVPCKKDVQLILIDTLKCDTDYDLHAYLMHGPNLMCLVSKYQSQSVSCPARNNGDIIAIVIGSSLGFVVIMLVTVVACLVVYICRKQGRYNANGQN